ncbi:endonuclease III [Corynebacterium tuberculostearicum]|uniref:endonuclease III n=1 Tax=Corynebacterium TaxID=1716 RepID=UPI001EF325B1|nr:MULTISPECIES: endonuclease III [Corynebacterium]MCG7442088.1 endonuclease III [Corynebacterium sp. ACRPQ]MCG7465997.1 endonuclease III [Corynebacterium sp. ACRPJ]MCG7468226.1 endonuclease III [Corynebacterium sp. ACRPE]MDK4231148.1 endonuclease III [Corynebacterium tuberculostearicum]MDV2429079.1 endonuclease III [Corynebacterium tuberculostearicum]
MNSALSAASAPELRAPEVNRRLAQEYPDARCALDYDSPLQLLIATVLSAQCTDERVNSVTPELFARYPEAADYAAAQRSDLESILRPLGFQRAKAGHLLGIGEKLVADFQGEVPRTVKELTSLPGVGRKTALVVLGNAFGIPGLTVDTHFSRLMQRLGLTGEKTPVKIERDIAKLVSEEEWTMFSHRVIFHGRQVCHARTPECEACVLRDMCPAARGR